MPLSKVSATPPSTATQPDHSGSTSEQKRIDSLTGVSQSPEKLSPNDQSGSEKMPEAKHSLGPGIEPSKVECPISNSERLENEFADIKLFHRYETRTQSLSSTFLTCQAVQRIDQKPYILNLYPVSDDGKVYLNDINIENNILYAKKKLDDHPSLFVGKIDDVFFDNATLQIVEPDEETALTFTGKVMCIKMQHCDVGLGGALDAIYHAYGVKKPGVLSREGAALVFELFMQILGGVQDLHARNLGHHCLTPKTAFIQLDGEGQNDSENPGSVVKIGGFEFLADLSTTYHDLNNYRDPVYGRTPEDFQRDFFYLGQLLCDMFYPVADATERKRCSSLICAGNVPPKLTEQWPQITKLIQLLTNIPTLTSNSAKPNEQVSDLATEIRESLWGAYSAPSLPPPEARSSQDDIYIRFEKLKNKLLDSKVNLEKL